MVNRIVKADGKSTMYVVFVFISCGRPSGAWRYAQYVYPI